MSNPLSPVPSSTLNAQWSPPTAQKDITFQNYPVADSPTSQSKDRHNIDGPESPYHPPSSPFVSEIDLGFTTPRTSRTPSRQRSPAKPEAIGSATSSPLLDLGTERKSNSFFSIHEDKPCVGPKDCSSLPKVESPSKQIFSELASQSGSPQENEGKREEHDATSENNNDERPSTAKRTPRFRERSSSRKRPHTNNESPTKQQVLRYNEGLTIATTTWDETIVSKYSSSSSTEVEEQAGDDTCFSTFSEIPAEATKRFQVTGSQPNFDSSATPRAGGYSTPATSRRTPRHRDFHSPSPTPRRQKTPAGLQDGDTTNLLLDFTQQMESFSGASRRSPTKSGTEPNLLHYLNGQRSPAKVAATPSKGNNILNLLDFELPPAPTPRSVPSITVRELESMKSNYQSEISSLRATLSGREAEVESLKKAVSDAERRVGEAQETMREERNAREHVEKEKREWENRGKEVEGVLRNVKEEIMKSDKEKEELVRRLEESERRAEEAETRAIEAKGKNGPSTGDVSEFIEERGGNAANAEEVQRLVHAQLDQHIQAVCRDLHQTYKKKHETKVATLKKSYEAKAEKRCAELQGKIDELVKQNEDLQVSRDATFSGTIPSGWSEEARAADQKKMEEQKAEIEEHKAKLAGLAEEVKAMKFEQSTLRQELEGERVEKGDMVALIEEMLALQQSDAASSNASNVVDDLRKSVSRPSGLKPPGGGSSASGGESRIGRAAPAGLTRSTSGGKSRIMTNIERMGSGRSAG
ncbi:MAG: hypothetical protein M1820_006602 [Bogoriella megaspora]|nr:MAG: hypothetical protein M1820_006602 [Bogoriella megaspora]